MKLKINLFKKIFFFSIFLIIFTVGISFLISSYISKPLYINKMKEEILKIKQTVTRLSLDDEILENYIEDLRNTTGINVYILENNKYDADYDIVMSENFDDIDNGFQITKVDNTNINLLLYKEKISDNTTLFITTSLTLISSMEREIYILNLFTFIIALSISIFISKFFAKKITNNISEINRIAKKITNLDFSEKLTLKTTDELKELGNDINIMANSISTSIENLNSFVSNASHELKTPISIINAQLQLLLSNKLPETEKKNYYLSILKQTEEMNTLIKNLLLISKLSAVDFKINKAQTRILPILMKSIEKFEFLELKKDIEFEIQLENQNININEKLLKIVLDNLVQNALKYSPKNSIIKIYHSENKIYFENPTYFDEKETSHNLCQTFFRGAVAKELHIDGNGLGLSIVRKILELNSIAFNIEIKENKFIFIIL